MMWGVIYPPNHGEYMPKYDYKCEQGKIYEVQQSMSEDKLTECLYHKNCKVQRLMGTPMILSDDIGRGSKRMTDKHLYKELDID